MSERRAQTLEALSTFIESQKALLARTKSDIVRIEHLRHDIAASDEGPSSFARFSEQWAPLDCANLSEQKDVVPDIHKDLDWSLLSASDSTPFKILASRIRDAHDRQRRPSAKQTSPLSPLQQMVKTARATLVDPIIPLLASIPPPDPEDDEPLDPEDIKRIQERQKIRELKLRRIHGDSGTYGLSGLSLLRPGSEAVFVRRDQEDESAEVDIDLGDGEAQLAGKSTGEATGKTTPSSALEMDMNVDTPATSVASPQSVQSMKLPAASSRSRRHTAKAAVNRTSQQTSSTKKHAAPPPPPPSSAPAEGPAEADNAPKLDKKGKPRPETYKQAWSMSEQHLLERLLEEIPDGEKNRWAKISKAMDGKRTPRQVASRVQKYYEKLKRFGVDVGQGAGRANDS